MPKGYYINYKDAIENIIDNSVIPNPYPITSFAFQFYITVWTWSFCQPCYCFKNWSGYKIA